MRLSVHRDSPFYNGDIVYRTQCYLNGEKLDYCVEADEEAGWATVLAVGPNGLPICEGDTIPTRDVFGKVELRTDPA